MCASLFPHPLELVYWYIDNINTVVSSTVASSKRQVPTGLEKILLYTVYTSSTRFSELVSLSVENEQADAGRDGRTHLVTPDSQARTGTTFIFPVQLTTSRVDNLTRSIHTLLYVLTIRTYILGSTTPYCI